MFSFIWFSIFVKNEADKKDKYGAFEEDVCNITDISIPKEYPNMTYSEGWNECYCQAECSRHTCKPKPKSYYSCIKFYSDISSDVMIQYKFGDNKPCTMPSICVCPPTKNGYLIQLIDAKEIYNVNNNSLKICYHDNPITEIYLDDDNDVGNLIVLIVMMMILLFIIGCISCYLKRILDRRRTNERYYVTVFLNNCCLECKYATGSCTHKCYLTYVYMYIGCKRILCYNNVQDTEDVDDMVEISMRTGILNEHNTQSLNYDTFQNPYNNGELEYFVNMENKTNTENVIDSS